MSVHSSSIIDPSAKIGRNVKIGPFVVIGPGVTIGDNCEIISHAVIEHTTLGNHCQVFPQSSLGLAPQHLKYKGEPTSVVVGNNCVFREGVTVHRGTPFDHNITLIGDNGYFMALSHIAHDCVIGNNVVIANAAQLGGHVKVGDNCFISGGVGIHQFVRIGKGAILGGGSMASMDVAPFCIAQGDRAQLRGLNIVGLRRLGLDRSSIKLVKEAYKTIFLSGLTLTEALNRPELLNNNPFVKEFYNFFLEPKRGYVRPVNISLGQSAEEELSL